MANNPNIEQHRVIIENILVIDLNNRMCLASFRNLLRREKTVLEQSIEHVPYENAFRQRVEVKISFIEQIINWLTLRIACLHRNI